MNTATQVSKQLAADAKLCCYKTDFAIYMQYDWLINHNVFSTLILCSADACRRHRRLLLKLVGRRCHEFAWQRQSTLGCARDFVQTPSQRSHRSDPVNIWQCTAAQGPGRPHRLRNGLYCVGWGTKLCSIQSRKALLHLDSPDLPSRGAATQQCARLQLKWPGWSALAEEYPGWLKFP